MRGTARNERSNRTSITRMWRLGALLAAMALLAAACGSADDTETNTEAAPTTDTAAEDTEADTANTTEDNEADTASEDIDTGNNDLTAAIDPPSTTTEPEPEGLADGDYGLTGTFTVTDVGDPPEDLAWATVLKPYENWVNNDGEEVNKDEAMVWGTVSCDGGTCTFDLEGLGYSGLTGWRFTAESYGGNGYYVNPEDTSYSEALIVETPQPLVLTDSGYETSFAGIATCRDETSEIAISLLFDAEDLLGEANGIGNLDAKVSGGLNVDVEMWGREEGDGWAVCWLPSVTFEQRER